MLQDGSSWRQPMRRRPALPDCTARPTGRTTQPPAACTKPFNGPCCQGQVLVAQATKPLNGPCGQGAILVAQATATHMPCELWLHCCIEKYASRTYVGRGGRHSESAQSVLLQCSAKYTGELHSHGHHLFDPKLRPGGKLDRPFIVLTETKSNQSPRPLPYMNLNVSERLIWALSVTVNGPCDRLKKQNSQRAFEREPTGDDGGR